MQKLFYLLSILCFSYFASAQITTTLIDSTSIIADRVIDVDAYGTIYYTTKDNTFHKKNKDTTITYTNVQLSKITSASSFNPLKINLFYEDFNSVVILDNRLAEIFKIDFNVNRLYKNVSHIATGYDNTIWIFNQDTQQLELFDFKANTLKVKSLPIPGEALALKSNYNYCWLLTEEHLYKFNYFGINIMKLKNDGFDDLGAISENLVLKKNNKLYYLENNESKSQEILLPKLLINAFFVNNETLYIYDNEYLYKYQLKIN